MVNNSRALCLSAAKALLHTTSRDCEFGSQDMKALKVEVIKAPCVSPKLYANNTIDMFGCYGPPVR